MSGSLTGDYDIIIFWDITVCISLSGNGLCRVISQKTKLFIIVASVPSHTEVSLKTKANKLLAEYNQNCIHMAKARSDIEIVCKHFVIL
jgi:hypothetical protein